MKFKLTYFLLFLSITFSISAQNNSSNFEKSKNIVFTPLSFEKALQKAKKENKLIFIDTYTSWCKPCKEMDKFTFTDSTLSSYFNSNFINLKIDMETEEGKKLGRIYETSVVPTLLFLDKEGNLLSKYVGALAAYELLPYAKTLKEGRVFSSEAEINRFIHKGAKQKYFENPCDVDLVITYLGVIPKSEKEMILIKNRFLECVEQKNEYSKQQAEFLLERLIHSRNEKTYKFYYENKHKFEKNYGDSIMAYENYMEEIMFFNEIDKLNEDTKNTSELTKENIKKIEEIISNYESFSNKLEIQSRERGFERPISHIFVTFITNREAMKFYYENKENKIFAKYLLKYAKNENFEKYISEIFRNDSKMPMYFLSDNTSKYLKMEIKEEKVLSHLSTIWKRVLDKKYLASFSDYFIATKVFYYNKEKQEAQKMLQRVSKLKKSNSEEKQYEYWEAKINQL